MEEVANPLVYEKALEKLVFDECFAQVVDHRGPNDSTWRSKQKTQGVAIHLQVNALCQICETHRKMESSQNNKMHTEMHEVND